jgi:branched-chain amino acid transport system substrate-binding protein
MLTRRRFLIASSLFALNGCSGRSTEDPLYIGYVGPLSGTSRAAGEAMQRGMLLALEDANSEDNRIAGRRLAILHADCGGSPERGRSEAVRLVTLNPKLAALTGGRGQASADRLAQAVQPYPAVLLTSAPCSTAALEGVFSLDVAPSFRGESLARFAAGHLKARHATLVTDEKSPFCAAAASAFTAQWRSTTGQSLVSLDADSIAKRKPSLNKTDVVVLAGSADALVRTVLDAKRPGVPLLFAGEPADWPTFEKEAGEDAYTVLVHATSKFDEAGEKFLAKYKEKFHEDVGGDAGQGCELIRVLAAALRESKGTGGLKLREVLVQGEDFPGLTGKLRFKDGRAVRPLFAVRAGNRSAIQTFNS